MICITRNLSYQGVAYFLVLVLSETALVLDWKKMNEPIFDHVRLDVYRLAINYVATSLA